MHQWTREVTQFFSSFEVYISFGESRQQVPVDCVEVTADMDKDHIIFDGNWKWNWAILPASKIITKELSGIWICAAMARKNTVREEQANKDRENDNRYCQSYWSAGRSRTQKTSLISIPSSLSSGAPQVPYTNLEH